MFVSLVGQIIAGIIGFWAAIEVVPNVEFIGSDTILVLCGVIFGLINFFIKPVLNFITLPLRIITLGLFSLVINIAIIWIIDIIFPELIIRGFVPLFWTTIIIWGLSLFINSLIKNK